MYKDGRTFPPENFETVEFAGTGYFSDADLNYSDQPKKTKSFTFLSRGKKTEVGMLNDDLISVGPKNDTEINM